MSRISGQSKKKTVKYIKNYLDFFVNKQKKIDEKENIDKRRCVVVMDQIPEIEFLISLQWV